METMIEYARLEGLVQIEGEVLAENTAMLEIRGKIGFAIETHP